MKKPLEGEESATVWRQGDRLFHAVSVPMVTDPTSKGVLIAGYGINEALASDIRKLTHSEIAYLDPRRASRRCSPSPRWGRARPSCATALGRAGARRRGRRGAMEPLRPGPRRRALRGRAGAAQGGHRRDRGLGARPAQHGRGDGVLPPVPQQPRPRLAGGDGRSASASPTSWPRASPGPCARWSDLVERARDGSYAGAVQVDSRRRDRRPGPHLQQPARRPAREGADDRLPARGHDDDEEGRAGGRPRHRPPTRAAATTVGAAGETITLGGVTEAGGDAGPEKGEPLRRPLRGPGHARQGRHGRRLPRPRPAARRGRGPQGAARARC